MNEVGSVMETADLAPHSLNPSSLIIADTWFLLSWFTSDMGSFREKGRGFKIPLIP